MKFDTNGSLQYSAVEPTPDLDVVLSPFAIVSESSGSVILGYSGSLHRLSSDATFISTVADMPDSISNIAIGPRGNIFVSGAVESGNPGSGVCILGPYTSLDLQPADIYIVKLRAGTLEPIYSTRLFGQCKSYPTALVVDERGEATLTAITFGDFPMMNPTLSLFNGWHFGKAAIARLSADGQDLIYSSFLESANPAILTLARDGSPFVGVSQMVAPFTAPHAPYGAALLHLPAIHRPRQMTITRAANAFDPAGAIVPGTLVSITGQSLTSLEVDLGLNPSGPLPNELAGVQVLFDGIPAQLLRAAIDQVICIVPASLPNPDWTTVEVISSVGQRSEPLVVPIAKDAPGILSASYPAPPIKLTPGIVFNEDGTENDSTNPAAVGSTVTFYGTGIAAPGPVPIYWDGTILNAFILQPMIGVAAPAAGYLPGVYAISFQVPYLRPNPAVIGGVGANVFIYVK